MQTPHLPDSPEAPRVEACSLGNHILLWPIMNSVLRWPDGWLMKKRSLHGGDIWNVTKMSGCSYILSRSVFSSFLIESLRCNNKAHSWAKPLPIMNNLYFGEMLLLQLFYFVFVFKSFLSWFNFLRWWNKTRSDVPTTVWRLVVHCNGLHAVKQLSRVC